MQKYELLAIFPGTLDEAEVDAAAEKTKELIEKNGGTEIAMEKMGKSRLAYPMKHIRYGYFRMYYFFAEPSVSQAIAEKLLMSNLMLRAIVHRHDPKAGARKLSEIVSDVAIAAEREEARKDMAPAERSAEVIYTMSRPVQSAETPVRTEAVEMEDIDKKLDELLESDLTKV